MCGRFNIIDDSAVHSLLESLGLDMRLETRYNIAPTESIPVITNTKFGLNMHNMRWWLTPSWVPEITNKFSMFNAKSETVDTSKAFRRPFLNRRGIVPVSSFIEWKEEENGKQPYLIRQPEKALAFAAVWDIWEKDDFYIESCAILTTCAKSSFMHIHSRMPVMLSDAAITEWLEPSTATEYLKRFFNPESAPTLEVFPVSTAINSARNKDDRAVTPIGQTICV